MNKKLLTALRKLQPWKWVELPGSVDGIQNKSTIFNSLFPDIKEGCFYTAMVCMDNEEAEILLTVETRRREAIQGFYDICELFGTGKASNRIANEKFKSLTGLSFEQVYEKIQEVE